MFRNYTFDEKDPSEKHSFEIHDVDISIINGIRRVILTDIPVFGMIGESDATVQIIKNNGPLHNEILSHRIGLIPVCLTEDETETLNDNDIELELNVLNDSINTLNITSGDIKGTKNGKKLTQKELDDIFPKNKVTNNHILITRLRTNEQLHFKATIVKKTARYNASFCPVSLSNFYYMEDPKKVKKYELSQYNILDKERAYYVNKYGDPCVVQFEIEPINNFLGPKYLFNKAIEIIIDKLYLLISNLTSESLGSNGVTVLPFQNTENTFDFTIKNEDDTLGNIIQSYLFQKYIREEKLSKDGTKCTYIGYICPHPLKAEIIVRVTLEDQTNFMTFVKFLESNCIEIIDELTKIKKEWNKFSNK